MTYPNTPGFQAHSETSRQAAEQVSTANSMENKIISFLFNYPSGFTADELRECMEHMFPGAQAGTYSARLRGLELKGLVKKTNHTRLTRNQRRAFVYVHATYPAESAEV